MRTLLKALFGVLLVALLLWKVDLRAITDALSRYTWPWLMAALALMASSWLIAAARWRLFVPQLTFLRLLELTLIGQFYSIVLPGQLAGELVKAYRAAKGHVDAERLATSVVMDRVIGTIALLLVASTGLLLSRHHVPTAIVGLFAGATLALVVCLFVLRIQYIHVFVNRMISRLGKTRVGHIAASLHRVVDAWCDFSRAPLRLLASLTLGIAFQLLGVAIFATLGHNLGVDLPVTDWAWIIGVVSLAVLIPVSVGGIGLREGALVGCLGFLGIAAERALALSFGVFAITLAGAAVGGVLEFIEMVRRRNAAPKMPNR